MNEEKEKEKDIEKKLQNDLVLFYDLYGDYSCNIGKSLSKKERESLGLRSLSLLYGEVEMISLQKILNKMKEYSKQYNKLCSNIFYDLGSGLGKVVFAAALLQDFHKVIGIEILEGLYTASMKTVELWRRMYAPRLKEEKQKIEIEFYYGDFCNENIKNWSDADFVFINSTCFEDSLLSQIALQCEGLKPGAIIASMTFPLNGENIRLLGRDNAAMSWGIATVFYHVVGDMITNKS